MVPTTWYWPQLRESHCQSLTTLSCHNSTSRVIPHQSGLCSDGHLPQVTSLPAVTPASEIQPRFPDSQEFVLPEVSGQSQW